MGTLRRAIPDALRARQLRRPSSVYGWRQQVEGVKERESAAQQVLKRAHDHFGSLLQCVCSLLLAFLLLTFSGAWVCLWPWLCREPSALVSLFLTFARCSRCPLSINTVSAELEECSECVCMTVYASVCVCVWLCLCVCVVYRYLWTLHMLYMRNCVVYRFRYCSPSCCHFYSNF